MNPKGLEIVDLRELNILRHLTDEELADITAVHVYGGNRSAVEGLSALYVTKNDEVFLVGLDNLVGKSNTGKVPEGCKGILDKSVKVNELSGKSVRKIVVGAEFGAALTTSNDLYMWGCDAGTGLAQLALVRHYDGSSCTECGTKLTVSTDYDEMTLSVCSYCISYKNQVSTIPHTKHWNGQTQIVLGYKATGTKPPPIPKLFCVSCGFYKQCSVVSVGDFCLVRCTGGSRYHLVDGNSLRIPPQTNPAPHKVTFPTPLTINDIAAGTNFLLVQTSEELLIWGDLSGFRFNTAVQNPDKAVFARVACGSAHLAVISDVGGLYTCGVGDEGQLGYTSSPIDGHMTLKKVSLEEPAVDVACGQNSTACLLQNGSHIVYGNFAKVVICRTLSLSLFDSSLFCVPTVAYQNYKKIVESTMKHLLDYGGKPVVLTGDLTDVFIHLHGSNVKTNSGCLDKGSKSEAELQETRSPTRSDSNTSVHQSSNLAHLFGQILLSDLTLKLADGDFPAHRCVLYGSSAYFSQFFTESESPGVLDMSSYNASAYRGLLKYFYGVSRGQMTCQDMFDLYVLAISYKEDWIIADVFSKLKNSIDSNNVLLLHDKAKAANATELLEECLAFMDAPDFKKSLLDSFTQNRNMLADLLRLSVSNRKS